MPDGRLERTRAAYAAIVANDTSEIVARHVVANTKASCQHRGNLLFDFTRMGYRCPCGALVDLDGSVLVNIHGERVD